MTNDLQQAAQELAALLAERKLRIVFAESCTAGLVSATLAQVPGISNWLCGSAITYREATKSAWLQIPPTIFEQHNVVSSEVARAMAIGVLSVTPEADIAASITGHLGPDAPPALDGETHMAIARRAGNEISANTLRCRLRATLRLERQREAALNVLMQVIESLSPANDE